MAKPRPIQFRAVHTENRWRAANHETLKHAISGTSITDVRSAKALFENRNKSIDVVTAGLPKYVVVWDSRDSNDGTIIRPDNSYSNGLREQRIPRKDIEAFESEGQPPSDAELERYFQSTRTKLKSPPEETMDSLIFDYESRLVDSLSSTSAQRRQRLSVTDPVPPKVNVRTWVFIRNTDVVAEVLENAAGVCGGCQQLAPFVRKSDGTPYLEVHHRVPLAAGGPDTVANAVALCPNCHRQRHYGRSAT
jgi:5-methylcytosine-specific restriction endonuclease McrA